jgi:hypothetical protein
MGTSPKLAPIKSNVHNLGKKPLPKNFMLKNEIRVLWRDRRVNRYQLGAKLAELQTKVAHGEFLPIVTKDIRIPIHTAYRAMKFFRRTKLKITEQILQNAKFRQKFPYEDVEDFETALESKQADAKLQALDAIRDIELQNIRAAAHKRTQDAKDVYRIAVILTGGQREPFKKTWLQMEAKERSSIVVKAVMHAGSKN